VLNDTSPTVRRLLAGTHRPDVFAAGVRSMYVTALLLAGEPLRGRDAATMTDAMTVLLDAGLGPALPTDEERTA
jgi:molecular chaperone HtpG